MDFEQFKRITYHTRLCIRIPGSRTVLNKVECMHKGRFSQAKADIVLKKVYERENYAAK